MLAVEVVQASAGLQLVLLECALALWLSGSEPFAYVQSPVARLEMAQADCKSPDRCDYDS